MKNQRAVLAQHLYTIETVRNWLNDLVGNFLEGKVEIVERIDAFQVIPERDRWHVIAIVTTTEVT